MYVRVNREQEFGFWEIDLNLHKALFRENTYKKQNNSETLDYTTVYNTVSSYLQSPDFFENKTVTNEHGRIHVKAIIKNRKTLYSHEPFCTWYKLGVDAHDPNTMLVCDKLALIIDQHENLLCGIHANETFTNKFLSQD